MLTFLKIKNVALIDELSVAFGDGLNLLTGETGSGKSIIVDSLGALTGERVSSDLIKQGCISAVIEGVFSFLPDDEFRAIFAESGPGIDDNEGELIIRREISAAGKNRIFANDHLITQALLKRIGSHLVDIHGQGEQTALYDIETHVEMLDEFAGLEDERSRTADAYTSMMGVRSELAALKSDEAEKLQLLDILQFQIDEIKAANLVPGEETELEAEKLRLSNVEKLTALGTEAFALLYDNDESTAATLEKAQRRVSELAEFESGFGEYADGIASARAVIEDLAIALRDFSGRLEFSPARLQQIEDRLAEITRLTRKYGGSIEEVFEHLKISEERLKNIETAEVRQAELDKALADAREAYIRSATDLHDKRSAVAARFQRQVEENLKSVALEKARFEVRIDAPASHDDENAFTERGFDRVEFYFSANPGEPTRPLAKVVSGGEASRLMLILKTTIRSSGPQKTAVFDEVDVGIGGRVAEAVGRKLKVLAASRQVLCVTHQPQIASLADRHLVVDKAVARGRTVVSIRELDQAEQVEEIARMLAGEQITDAARENARAMLAGAK